jgi:hypothetical protein
MADLIAGITAAELDCILVITDILKQIAVILVM